jgi:hypothetical protein
MCMGLDRDHGRDLVCRLFDCDGWTLGRRLSSLCLAEVAQNSSSNLPVACSDQNQCYAPAWGSCVDYRCTEEALEFRLALEFFFAAQACESAGPPTC